MTTASKPSIESLARDLIAHRLFENPLELRFGSCRIRVRLNEPVLRKKLDRYFRAFIDPAGNPDYELMALHCEPPELDLQFEDWPRDPGKVGRKDTICDIAGGRVLRKIRTGMQFLISPEIRIAFGDCLTNDNQVINFVISQYLSWLRNRDWEICHAAGLVLQGKGLGIAAFSGGGKSTLMLHLMSRGGVYVSNDRLLIRDDYGGPRMAGVPKMPRVNPGTLLNNADLVHMLPPKRQAELNDMLLEELWDLEEKYDVDIESVFGPDRLQLEAPLSAFIVLNWNRNAEESFTLNPVDLSNRDDLLAAIMKTPGPFFLPQEGNAPRTVFDLDKKEYVRRLQAVAVFEATGRANFDTACETILKQVR